MTGLGISVLLINSSCEAVQTPEKIRFNHEAVSKRVLENGLVLLALSQSGTELTSIHAVIRAGSGVEGNYLGSGISHFVEHMVFKGTPTRPAARIEEEIKAQGGIINGSTSQDLTDFYIVCPASRLREVLSILKDMLANAVFDETEVEKERSVILKEIKFNNDSPESRLVRLINETAYLSHPYRYPAIGYENAFLSLGREDLVKYYRKMYVPNRMTIAIVGAIDPKEAIASAENEFRDFGHPDYGSMPVCPAEPTQISIRQREDVVNERRAYLGIAFHSTGVLDKDLFAMDVISMALGRGDNSRLNKRLVKTDRLAYSVSCVNHTPRDPGLFMITAVLDTDKIDKAVEATNREIEKVKYGGLSEEELACAKKMVLADYIFSRQTIESIAAIISSNYELTGDFDFSERYVDGIQAVSNDQVKAAAAKYLSRDGITIVRLVPPESAALAPTKRPETAPSGDSIEKTVLPNGLRLLIRQDKRTPTISLTVAVAGGLAAEDESTNGISNFTARMLLKGTRSRKAEELAGAIEALGGKLEPFSGFNSFGINAEFLKADFGKVIDIIKDVLTDSVFPQEEIDKEKAIVANAARSEEDDIFQNGMNYLRKEMFGSSPYGRRLTGTKELIDSFKREEIVNFYKKYCTPPNIVISVSGDIEPKLVSNRVKDLFKDMKGTALTIPSPVIKLPDSIRSVLLKMRKEESLVLLGFITTTIKSDDRYALDVLGSVLSGQSGRLFTNLRGKKGIAYALGCSQKTALDTGYLVLYAATSKEKIDEVKGALIEEIELIGQNGVGVDELDIAKKELRTGYDLEAQKNGFFSITSALEELYGLGCNNLYRYKGKIENVSKEDIRRIAAKYLNPKACVVIIISPQ